MTIADTDRSWEMAGHRLGVLPLACMAILASLGALGLAVGWGITGASWGWTLVALAVAGSVIALGKSAIRIARDRDALSLRVAELDEQIEGYEETERLASVGGWSLSVETDHVHWSHEVRRIHEVPDDYQPVLETAIEFYAPEARDVVTNAITTAIEEKGGWDLELPFVTGKGNSIWVRSIGRPVFRDGELVALRGAFQDITARKKAEEALYQSDRRLDFAMRAARLGLWDWQFSDNHVFFSDMYFEMLGYDPDSFPQDFSTWEQLVHPDDKPQALEAIQEYMSGQSDRYRAEFRFKASDGRWLWMLATGEIENSVRDGTPERMIGVHIDIDEAKRFAVEIAKARRAAEFANRSKSEFLANMSHEIRTPMTSIVGYSEMLGSDDLSKEDQATYIDAVQRNSRHLLYLINEILDLSKIEAGKMEVELLAVELPELLRDVLAVFDAAARERRIELSAVIEGRFPKTVRTDPTRLRQVMVNLVGNALKFTREGFVRIRAWIDAEAQLRIAVEDSGIGIDDAAQERLFDAFSQADSSTTRNYGGTGLGLAISQRLTELLGGSIAIESVVGEGSVFTVTVDPGPLSEVEWVEGLDVRVSDGAPVSQVTSGGMGLELQGRELQGRVLVAEDGFDNQRLIRIILTKVGLDVEVVENGQLAVDRLDATRGTDEAFDLVLMDLQMPVMDGLTATALLRERGHEVPIVALTANATEDDRAECLRVGCNEFSSKPIERHKLIGQIAELITNNSEPV